VWANLRPDLTLGCVSGSGRLVKYKSVGSDNRLSEKTCPIQSSFKHDL